MFRWGLVRPPVGDFRQTNGSGQGEGEIMKSFRIVFVLVCCLVSSLVPRSVAAHPGGTNSSGCHTCKRNCSSWGLFYGQYHCHGNGGSQSSGGGGASSGRHRSLVASCVDRSANLSKGELARIQQALKFWGFDPGAIDGVFGRRTASALRRFEVSRGLPLSPTNSIYGTTIDALLIRC